jgi:acyl-coenzyme A thioesterase PaaI-like protein
VQHVAFFEDLGAGRFRATSHAIGPWDERFQHGGPPSALLGRAIERTAPRADVMVARITVEILGPVPVADLSVRAEVVRPGRSVELVEATLTHEERPVARATAWRVRRTAGVSVESKGRSLALPEQSLDNSGWGPGYMRSMEWRFAEGSLDRRGPAAAWARMRVPLVDDEPVSPLSRVLVLADSGNGVSRELAFSSWQFINPELTVHLHREAVGEWICLDAATTISDGGVGLATSQLSDADGPIGVGAQSLLVSPRP